jgi:hypothetical protein
MSHTSQISKYKTLGASVDTKIIMLTWTNQIKTRVNIPDQSGLLRGTSVHRGTLPLRGTIDRRTTQAVRTASRSQH